MCFSPQADVGGGLRARVAGGSVTYRDRYAEQVAMERNCRALTVLSRGLTQFCSLAFCFWPIWSIDIGCREDVP